MLKKVAHIFAENFMQDELYLYMFPDEKTRLEAMYVYFEIYLKVFAKYGDLVTTSDEFHDIAYIYYEERFKNDVHYKLALLQAGMSAIKLLHYIKLHNLCKLIKTVHHTSSAWIYEVTNQNYIHLDLIAVQKDYRGLGKAKHLINYVIEQAKMEGKLLTLETQSKSNVDLYEHMAFKIVKKFQYQDLVQYCMVYKE